MGNCLRTVCLITAPHPGHAKSRPSSPRAGRDTRRTRRPALVSRPAMADPFKADPFKFDVESPGGFRAVLRNTTFRNIWFAQLAAQLADKFLLFSLIILAYDI